MISAVIGVVAAIFVVVVGAILISALFPINPFMAIVGVILMVAVGVAVVIGFIKSQS